MKQPARNRANWNMAAYCRQYGKRLIDELFEMAMDAGNKVGDRVKAANVLLDRGYGKPVDIRASLNLLQEIPEGEIMHMLQGELEEEGLKIVEAKKPETLKAIQERKDELREVRKEEGQG